MTSTKYFTGIFDVHEIKATYRRLAFKFHPDVSGYDSTEDFKELGRQYENALKGSDGQTSVGSDGKEHTYRYNSAMETRIMEVISALISLKMKSVEVEMIGIWVWVSGDTKPYKESLKKLGLKWHGKRKNWYWRQVRARWSGKSMDELRGYYGSRNFSDNDSETGMAAA